MISVHSISAIIRQALMLTALVLLSVLQETDALYFYRYYRSYRYTYYRYYRSYRYYSSRIYVGYYYGTYSYDSSSSFVSVGAIIGSVIGSLTFIGLVVGLIVLLCCLRQRRQAAAAARTRAVPMTVGGTTMISTVSPGGYPAAPEGGPPYDNSKQGAYSGVAPPPYPAAADPAVGYAGGAAGYQDNAAYAGYQNGQQAPPYPNPTAADPQMPPPLPATGAEQQRF